MAKMKKQIERRIRILWVGFFILSLLNAYDNIGPGFPVTDYVSEYILEFQQGLRTGGILVILFVICRYMLAMRDEQKLKKLFYHMTDERMTMVRMKSGAPIMLGSAVALLAVSMVAMYFNTTVSLTLIACAVFLIVVAAVGKVVWNARLTSIEDDSQ